MNAAVTDYQNGMTFQEIGKKYGASEGWMHHILKGRGIKARPKHALVKYKIDGSYFDSINSHEKAICLGFIWADGCVSQGQCKHMHLQITLHEQDEPYLKWMNEQMKNERPIYRSGRFVVLVGYHEDLIKGLLKQGIYPRKSVTIGSPTLDQVPDEFLSSFVLGVFEGDGSISKGNPKSFCANICGTDAFCQWLKALLKDKLDINASITHSPTKAGPPLARIGIGGNLQVMKFMEWMYSKAPHKMERKYAKYLELQGLYDKNMKLINDGRAGETAIAHRQRIRASWTLTEESKRLMSIGHAKIFHAKDPSGAIIRGRNITKFAQENGLGVCSFQNLVRGTRTSYRGWTIPALEEIVAAQAIGAIIEKFY